MQCTNIEQKINYHKWEALVSFLGGKERKTRRREKRKEKKRDRKRNLFLEQSQNIFIFSAYTDACTLSCKIVVASKRPLIFIHGAKFVSVCYSLSECLREGLFMCHYGDAFF